MEKQKQKYSKIYRAEESNREYRYNYKDCILEFINFTDITFDKDDNPIKTKLQDPEIIDSIGLSPENWKDNPKHWVEKYDQELEEEMNSLSNDFIKYELPYL